MFIDLNTFIKEDFIRQEMKNKSVLVTTIEEADAFAFNVYNGKRMNVIFEKTSLKNYCLSKIRQLCEDVNIINCNSSVERFIDKLQSPQELIIFDNVNECKNIDILNLIYNKKGIIIC